MAARAAAEAGVAALALILPTTVRLQSVRCRRESRCLVEVRGADYSDEWDAGLMRDVPEAGR